MTLTYATVALLNRLETYLPDGENMMPYGYDSYDQYIAEMDKYAEEYFDDAELSALYARFKDEMKRMNNKGYWSVLQYVGESDDRIFGLTHGKIYYWPCSLEEPVYEGVIDDEEFTSYLYATEASDWEILEDPTGMAYRTIYEKAKGHISRKKHDCMMSQIEKMFNDK